MSILLDKSFTATFDSGGVARIRATPDRARDTWRVSRYQVRTDSSAGTQCTVFLGSDRSGAEVDFTRTGNGDTSEQLHPLVVDFGQPLFFIWSGGDVGAIAHVSILGEVVKR